MQYKPRHTQQRGFTLLLATLLASLMLVLAASMFTLVQKEVILSSLGRDSQFAFYAADSAAECALYWDFRHQLFSKGSAGLNPTCDGQILDVPAVFPGNGVPVTFEYEPNGFCATVTVTKQAAYPNTTISSRGYSTSCAMIESSARTLERAVELRY
jgi:Tfp pilus assembly protein PilX